MESTDSGHALAGPRQLRLRYAGVCTRCGKELPKGTEALYEAATRTVRCVECNPAPAASEPLTDIGVAGSSARRTYEARHTAREERVRRRLGKILGGVVLAVTDDPQSTRAWARGASGEEKLAVALREVPHLKVLHDRAVPHTPGNIDHLLIAPAGVFVVDAKHYRGLIQIRDVGGFFKSDRRLYVGRRDCSHLATNMAWQTDAVRRALDGAGLGSIPVTPVVCFVDGDWPIFRPPEEFQGVKLEGVKSLKKLIHSAEVLDPAGLELAHHALAIAFPPK